MMIKRQQTGSKGRSPKRGSETGFVAFDFEKSTYHIDVERRKVYQKWVEVERTKQSAIFSAFQAASSLLV